MWRVAMLLVMVPALARAEVWDKSGPAFIGGLLMGWCFSLAALALVYLRSRWSLLPWFLSLLVAWVLMDALYWDGVRDDLRREAGPGLVIFGCVTITFCLFGPFLGLLRQRSQA